MCEQTVAMPCFPDDLRPLTHPTRPLPANSCRRLTDAQVPTMALVTARKQTSKRLHSPAQQ